MCLNCPSNQTEGRRKTAKATVKVTKPGTGKLVIKHKDYPHIASDITYFFGLKERHVLLYPLQVKLGLRCTIFVTRTLR